MSNNDAFMTLEDARRWFKAEAIANGRMTTCPCCDRRTKAYRRPLNLTMLRSLSWLHKESQGSRWVDLSSAAPRYVVATNQLPTVRWWGLAERNDADAKKADLRNAGLWRTTQRAALWLSGQIKVPKYIITYADEFIVFDGEAIGPRDIDAHFSFSEIMQPLTGAA